MNNVELRVRGEPLLSEEITVLRPQEAMVAMEAVIKRAERITEVNDPKSQGKASLVAQELQGLRSGLEANYRAAKAPVLAATRALDTLYKELDQPLEVQYKRIDRLVSGYHDEQRRQQELAEARRKAEERRVEEEHNRKIRELQREKEEAERKARLAEDAREKQAAQRQAAKLKEKIQTEEITKQVERENLPVASIPEPINKPIGGRPWTEYIVEMTDPIALYNAQPELLKIELRLGPAKEFAKALDESGKPLDSIPGLKIQKTTRTSFIGAASIRVHGEE